MRVVVLVVLLATSRALLLLLALLVVGLTLFQRVLQSTSQRWFETIVWRIDFLNIAFCFVLLLLCFLFVVSLSPSCHPACHGSDPSFRN